MIIWEGKSELDGSPIVAIATGGDRPSKNVKTGSMVQIWILRSDMDPIQASRRKLDGAICGDCPQRRSLGGACYVTLHQAPLSVYRAYKAGAHKKATERELRALREMPLRLGAYGDPCAVPFHVWESLLAQGCRKWTGYTHQWRDPRFEAFRGIVMASCDNESEAREARARGWRFFVVTAETPNVEGAIQCLSDAQGITCEACGICDGTRADSRSGNAASVAIQVHGALSRRFQLTVVR